MDEITQHVTSEKDNGFWHNGLSNFTSHQVNWYVYNYLFIFKKCK